MNFIYLDQNHWSKLERVFNGFEKDSTISNILFLIQDLIQQNKIKLIIDINRKWETSQREVPESRRRMTDLMLRLSKGFYVIPFFFLMEEEIKNYFYKKMGLGENNILDFAISNDVGYLFAGRPSLVGKSEDKEKLKEVNKLLNEYISRPEFVIEQFNKFSRIDEEARRKYVIDAENVRKPLREMKTNKQRKNYQLELDFRVLLNKIMRTFHLTEDAAKFISDEEKTNYLIMIKKYIPHTFPHLKDKVKFMKQFPLFYTHITLVDVRDRNLQRKILPGDNIDIVSYVVPIVYFDFLVGEKYFINLAKQEKLDQEFGCVLLKKLEDLEPYLNSL